MASRAPPPGPPAWRLLDGELLADPQALLAFSVLAPRWNPHAVTALSPPLRVERRVCIDLAAVEASSRRWTLTAQGPLGSAVIGTASTQPEQAEACLELGPGLWRLVLRMYDPQPGAVLPAVEVDGAAALQSKPLPQDPLGVFRTLAARRKPLHRLLQAHVLPLLHLRGLLGEARVRRIYLPVGNPETQFQYGTLRPGQRLKVEPPADLPPGCGLYLCCYDRASFPTFFAAVPAAGLECPPAAEAGSWLLRVVAGRDGVGGCVRVG